MKYSIYIGRTYNLHKFKTHTCTYIHVRSNEFRENKIYKSFQKMSDAETCTSISKQSLSRQCFNSTCTKFLS